MSKRSTKKSTTAGAKKAKPQTTPPEFDTPAPETVTRHELLGITDIVLVDPGDRLPPAARQALFDAQKNVYTLCVVQCAGYVFNIVSLPCITFIDSEGKKTDTYRPSSKNGQPAKA
jgi:hypothetical protein